jgi:hypothetical protein
MKQMRRMPLVWLPLLAWSLLTVGPANCLMFGLPTLPHSE